MDGDSITKIIILACLILCSAYFSATETAFSSMNRIRMKTMAENNKRAALALKLSENDDKLLSTILVGNNLANIAATSLATVLFVQHFHDFGAALSIIVMTVVILIFGEVSPKSLAKDYPERFAVFSAPILRVLMLILTWQFPTLAWGDPTLPSALRRFTSEFGMGSGGTTALLPPGRVRPCNSAFGVRRRKYTAVPAVETLPYSPAAACSAARRGQNGYSAQNWWRPAACS